MTSGKLLRVLGVAFGLAVIIGNTIGAGILRTPGSIAASLPSPWLFVGVWVLGGLYALVSSISIVFSVDGAATRTNSGSLSVS